MKNIIYKLLIFVFGVFVFTSCEKNDIPTIDVQNARAIAGFSGVEAQQIIFNPSENTDNTISVGVSTISDQDRRVQLRVNTDETTLDSEFYSISTLTPVIPAGEYSIDVVITTIVATGVPASDKVVVLELVSVESAEILSESTKAITFGLDVKCPSVDLSVIPGDYKIVADDFGTSVGDDMFEVVAGPGENEFTMVNPFDQPNPDADGAQNYMVTFKVSPNTGAITVARQAAWHYSNFAAAPDYGEGRVEGTGQALTCIELINFNLKNTVNAGSFGTYALSIKKQ
jgi:hypothetical protein